MGVGLLDCQRFVRWTFDRRRYSGADISPQVTHAHHDNTLLSDEKQDASLFQTRDARPAQTLHQFVMPGAYRGKLAQAPAKTHPSRP
jgi:hypothetical protein